mgnify:CR=1 FL=1
MMCLRHCWEMSNLPAEIAQPTIFFVPNLTPADVAERLSHINPPLASRARVVLDINKAERHIRGGMATKEKYEHEHQLRACSRDEE